MKAKAIFDLDVFSENWVVGNIYLPAQSHPGAKPPKPYTRPQIILELDLEIFPACWKYTPPVVTSDDLPDTAKPDL